MAEPGSDTDRLRPPRRRWRAGCVVAAALVVAGALAPWTVSGTAVRNSFATVRTARLVLTGDHAVMTGLLASWALAPLLAALVALAASLGRDRATGAGTVVLGAAALALVTAVTLAPIGTGAGPVLTAVAGVACLVAGTGLLVTTSRRSSR